MDTTSSDPRTTAPRTADRRRRGRLLAAGALVLATAIAGTVARGRTAPSPSGTPPEFTAADGRVRFTGRLDRSAVLQHGDGLVRMELAIRGRDAEPRIRAARLPTDLLVILDRSGSMEGEKIVRARAAIGEIVSRLGEQDRFALVAYSNDAALAIPLTPAAAAREAWSRRGTELAADGGTNMASGLDLGLDTIDAARAAGRAARVILISDGLANQGDASREGLVRRAGRAARGEYVLSAIGVGADFDEQLMTALADAGTGNYYYLERASDLASVFTREFDGARTTVAKALAVEIEPADGVEVRDAAGYPLVREGRRIVFRPGGLHAAQERRIWVTLAAPHATVGEQALGRFSLSYGDAGARTTLAFGETPRIAVVANEDDFFARVDKSAWADGVLVEAYNEMQAAVAREVKAGNRQKALDRIQAYRAEVGSMNDALKVPAATAKLEESHDLERDVAGAFVGPDQPARQNALSKSKGAQAIDGRRLGSK
jgi:Ca-activated chloride channel family protein